MKKAPKISFLVMIIFISLIFTPLVYTNTTLIEDPDLIRTSAPLGYNIHINGNWTYTEGNYSWCTGAGTSGNPYVIQDIEIDVNLDQFGIMVGNTTDYFRIENVTIYNAFNASVFLDNVDNGHLFNNSFSDNILYGLLFRECNDVIIEYNVIEDNGNGGIMFDRGNNFGRESNFIIRHNSIEANSQYGIYLYYMDYCVVWNNSFSGIGGQSHGLYIDRGDDNVVRNNSFQYHSSYGVRVVASDGNNITSNDIRFNDDGFWSQNSWNTIFTFNNVTDNSGDGMYFVGCSGMNIENNLIQDNQNGIEAWIVNSNNDIIRNVIRDNTNIGLSFPYDSNHNNLVYMNVFISNTFPAYCKAPDTRWNNSQYGNYWDTYGGLDTDVDGIGDIAYIYDENVTDYKPLMVANFSLLEDTDGDSISDYAELDGGLNIFGDEPTDPYDSDSDLDGLNDGEEITGSLNDGNPTDPNELDTDGDSFTDYDEITGSANTYNGDPMDPNKIDSDGDTIDDKDELDLGFNPTDEWHHPKSDLVILSNYSLDGDVISITIKNVGVWRASGVVVVVNISSEALTLYDNSLTGFDLEVNETKEIRILKSLYRQDLNEGENYFLSIYVDPIGVVNETNEGNNSDESILYNHNLSVTGLTSFQLALIIASSAIVLVAAAVASYLVLKQKKQKKEFRPLQLMMLEKFGSTLLYTHKFTKNNNDIEQTQEIVEKVESDEPKEDDMKEELPKEKKKASKKESKKVVKGEPKKEIDEILAAGAFSGIQSLLKSILQTEKGINEISHGEYTIYFNYGEKIICVMIAYGKFHRVLSTLKLFSTTFEEEFQNEITEFDGRVDVFSRAYQIVEKYFPK